MVNHGFMFANTKVKYAYGGSHRWCRTTLQVQVEGLHLWRLSQSSSPRKCRFHLGFSPNPPSKGDSVVERRIRGRRPRFFALHQGRSETKRDRQWPLGAPMVAYSGCGERKGRIGHGKRRSRTGMARVGGDVQLAGWRVSGGRAPSGRQGAADGDAGGTSSNVAESGPDTKASYY